MDGASRSGREDLAARSTAARLTPDQFAQQLQQSFRSLWLIAVGMLRDGALADDVVQEAAIVALGNLDEFDPATNFRAWMGQTVRFVAMNHRRREAKRRGASIESEQLDAIAGQSAATVEAVRGGRVTPGQQDFDDAMMEALNSLPDVARACLLLRTVEGLDYAEISAALEIPQGTAMSHVHRARAAMRERLSGSAAPAEVPQ